MKSYLFSAAATLALAILTFSSGAFAEPPEHARRHHWEMSAQDATAFTNARIAALKAGLELTPAQEKNWPALETSLRDIGKARAERMAEWREKRSEDHKDRDIVGSLRHMGKALALRGAELEKLADVAKPLYESLDGTQKRRFGVLLQAIDRPHGPHWQGRGAHHEDSSDDDD